MGRRVPCGAPLEVAPVSTRRRRCPFLRPPFVSEANPPKEEAMKYVLLIHQGEGAVPGNEAWEKLSEEEQKQVFADYQALNETPGVTPNDLRLDSPETATTVRVENG